MKKKKKWESWYRLHWVKKVVARKVWDITGVSPTCFSLFLEFPLSFYFLFSFPYLCLPISSLGSLLTFLPCLPNILTAPSWFLLRRLRKPLQHQAAQNNPRPVPKWELSERSSPSSSTFSHSWGFRDFCRVSTICLLSLKNPPLYSDLWSVKILKTIFFFPEKIELCPFVQALESVHCFPLFAHPHWD